MDFENFRNGLLSHFETFKNILETGDGDWTVKGFIDVYRNIYTVSVDTKVISKIIELMLFPPIAQFAEQHGYGLVLSEHQNHYPDISLIAQDGSRIALDLKSTYRTNAQHVNGFTLGAFTGYFRQRQSTKNITFPYDEYAAHFVLGIIYTRQEELVDEQKSYRLEDLENIVSVTRDFTFLLQEKWRIASDRPGSGNTKNIGSVRELNALVQGAGLFSPHSQSVFDDYWRNFLTNDMARAIDSDVPYRNLEEYWRWRNR